MESIKKNEIVQVLLILNFQNLFYYMKGNMWNGFTKCYEKFDSQCARSKGMMADSSLWGSMKADKDIFGRF
jgi:hypothetical protein